MTNYSRNQLLVIHVDGAASHLEATVTGIPSPGSVSVDAAGQFVYVGGLSGDPGEPGLAGVTVYLDLNDDGQRNDDEPYVLSAEDDPTTTAIDETGVYALAGLDAGTYRVAQIPPAGYERTYPAIAQGGTGLLSFVASIQDDQGGIGGLDGAYAVAASPAGEHVYVAGSTDDAVAVFARNAATGQLTYVQTHYDNVAGVDGLWWAVGHYRGDGGPAVQHGLPDRDGN